MREIKFRAWSKYHDEMCYDVNARYHRDDPEAWALMQFTGLLDKNGVDIYEGDIVEIAHDDSKIFMNEPRHLNYGDKCVVEWSNVNLAYYLMPVDTSIEEQQMDYYGSWSGWNWIKVIGNIWESPELLECTR